MSKKRKIVAPATPEISNEDAAARVEDALAEISTETAPEPAKPTLSSVQSLAQDLIDRGGKATKAQLLELAAAIAEVPARARKSSKPARRAERVFNSDSVVPLGSLSGGDFFTRNGRDLHFVREVTGADRKWSLTSVVFRAADKESGQLEGHRVWRGADSIKECRQVPADAVPAHVTEAYGIAV